MSEIRIIVFDLGMVMIDLARGWEGACAAAGIPYRAIPSASHMDDAFAELELLISTGQISLDEYGRRASAIFHGLYSPEEVACLYQAIIQPEFPGIAETVTGLKRAGYCTACLSNTCAAHWTRLTDPHYYPGICALDYQQASHLWHLAKPDMRIYRRFEQETGFAGAEIIFFDDRVENVAAARACNWHAVQINEQTPSCTQIHAALVEHGVEW